MLISMIVAMAKNRTIGSAGRLPWHLPEDLQRFKQLTMGHSLLMGRKTYQSIGRPLPGRQMIVLSRNPAFYAVGCTIVASLAEGIAAAQAEQLFICGGGEIYRQALPLVERIYLTELDREVAGDTYFPELPANQFKISSQQQFSEAEDVYHFSILQRSS